MDTKCTCRKKNVGGVLNGYQNCTDGNICKDMYEALKKINQLNQSGALRNSIEFTMALGDIQIALAKAEGTH